ncbi:hypothetical protein Ctob_011892, partial [Chrysochromulina tobinii]
MKREQSGSMEATLQQAKERVLPRKCGPFYENCYKFLVMYCNYVYSGKIKKIEPDTLRLAREMCEKAKTIGDPKNQNILNRLCELLERRLAKKEKKEKRNAGLEEKYLWEDVESMNADHLKPAKYMKNDKDLIIEELKVERDALKAECDALKRSHKADYDALKRTYEDLRHGCVMLNACKGPFSKGPMSDDVDDIGREDKKVKSELKQVNKNSFAGREEHQGNMLPKSPPESPWMLLPDPVADQEHPSDELEPLDLGQLDRQLEL